MSVLNIAQTGLIAFNKAMQVTSHNIANANTDGFIKSRAKFSELPSVGIPPIGTGVKFGSVLADSMLKQLDENILDQIGDVGFEQGIKDALDNLPENGIPNIVADLAAFEGAARELADDPNSLAVKQNFLGKAEQLTTTINNFNDVIYRTSDTIDTSISAITDQVNMLTKGIADTLQQGGNPTSQLQELGELINVDVNEVDGNLQVIAGNGKVLVDSNRYAELSTNDITAGIGGYAGGLRKAQEDFIPQIQTLLNNTTSKYMDRVNNEYIQGNSTPLFNRTGANFGIIPTDANQVNAGTQPDSNNVALNIVGLTNQPNNQSTVKSELLQADLTANNLKKSNTGSLERESFFLKQLRDDRADKYGVNLDVEAVNMLKYKRAYEAMAKVIEADNAMFSSLLRIV